MKIIVATYALEIMLLLGSSTLIWLGIKLKVSVLKHLYFNLSAIFLVLGVLELFLTFKNRPESRLSFSPQYYQYNKKLGYSIKAGDYSVEASRHWIESGEEIYTARYDFKNSRRSTPNSNIQTSKYALFLGGSLTFGEGVNDDETLPYFYNQNLTKKRNIRNYGLSGYGTHQVYTIAKHLIAHDADLTNAQDVDVFYWFITPHIWRTNGLSSWDRDGPQYQLKNNQVKHIGSFRQTQKRLPFIQMGWNFVWRHSAFSKSYIWGNLNLRDKKTELTLALIKETHQILKARGFSFTVLIQDEYKSPQQTAINKIKHELGTNGIQFIDVNDMFMQLNIDIDTLKIKGDGHPGARLYEHLGAHLAQFKRD